jgi:uncharacterized protein
MNKYAPGIKRQGEDGGHKMKFVGKTLIHAPAAVLFEWHSMPGVTRRLSPPFQNVVFLAHSGSIRDGDTAKIQVKSGPFKMIMEAEHFGYEEGIRFCDRQIKGPFKSWTHVHECITAGENSYIEDRIDYELPLGFLTNFIFGGLFNRKFERLFRYRHAITCSDVSLFYRSRGAGRMKIAISGASGLVGSELTSLLTSQGHEVLKLTRGNGGIHWDPVAESVNVEALEGVDAIVHLAGESVAQRWSDEAKQKIRDSRVKGTRAIAKAVSQLKTKPKVFVCASAIGFYGDRGSEPLNEESHPGIGFLAAVCKEWEESALPSVEAGVRTVNLRFGVIMSKRGGALAKMLPIFQLGAGGNLGSGQQYMSWIAIEDAVKAIYFAITNEQLSGPVNVVGPKPCTNAEFTATLGKVLHRPTFFPVPSFGPRLLMGEMADEMLFAGQKVLPSKLEKEGFQFQYPDLEAALRHELGR